MTFEPPLRKIVNLFVDRIKCLHIPHMCVLEGDRLSGSESLSSE